MENYKMFVPTEEGRKKLYAKAERCGVKIPRHDIKYSFWYTMEESPPNGFCLCGGDDAFGFLTGEEEYISNRAFLDLPEPEPEAPSHEEIMAKWWLVNNEWKRVSCYSLGFDKPYSLGAEYAYNKNSFIGLISADIPPEVE